MDKAVRNLLSFARPPEPKLTLVDINELPVNSLDFLLPQFARNSIAAERRLSPGLPWLTLDPDLMPAGATQHRIECNSIDAGRWKAYGRDKSDETGRKRSRIC